jgi:hypothetical protein
MKKTIAVLIVALIGFNATAQVEKGSRLVGVGIGSLSYTNSTSKTSYSNTPTVYNSDGNSFSISLYPNVAWFVQDGLAVGGGISISFYSSKSKSSNTSSSATSEYTSTQPSFYLSPYARKYFSGSKTGMPFVQVNAQYGIYGGKSKSTSSGGSSSETTTKPKGDWNAGLSLGYEQFVTKNIGLYGSIGFNYGSSKTDYDYKPSTGTGYTYTSDYSRFYIPVNIGLQVHLAAKTKK